MSRESRNSKSKECTNVQVVVRCRPQNSREKANREPVIVSTDSERCEVHVRQRFSAAVSEKVKRFTFDHVFGQHATQSELYETVVAPVVQEVMQGFNCTVFAYGQTGTGKTHTMEGEVNSEELKGIIPRAVEDIFGKLENGVGDHSVKISFMELYNEQLEDLLREPSEEKSRRSSYMHSTSALEKSTRLKLVENSRTGVVVQNLENLLVKNADDIYKHLAVALERRKTSATMMNKQSSRSHSVFTITIHIKETTPEGEDLLKVGKLNLVDLAGSECVGRSGASGDRKREAGNINQSLLTLGRVISALVEKRRHVPYRDSKLTRLLQESLGGKAKTTIIATVTPSASGLEETFSTLKYANTAKSIENKPEVNQRMTKRTYVKEIHVEMERLNLALAAARNKDGVYLPVEQHEELVEKVRSSEIAQKEAEQALERRSAELQDAIERFNVSEQDLAAVRAELAETQQTLVDTTAVLDVRESNLERVGEKGTETLREGIAASSDVEALHLKLDRKEKVVEVNADSARDLRGKIDNDLNEIAASIRDAIERRKGQDEEMCELLKAHAAAHTKRSESITKMITSMQKLCNNASSSLGASIDSYESSASSATTETHNNLMNGLEMLKNAIMEQSSEAISAFEEQKSVLASNQEAFVTFVETDVQSAVQTIKEEIILQKASEEETRLNEASGKVSELTETKVQKLKDLRETITSSLNKAEEAYKNVNNENVAAFSKDIDSASEQIALQKSQMESTLRKHASASASGLASIQSQMETMMKEFLEAQETRLAEAVAQITSQAEKAQSDLADAVSAHKKRADEESTQVSDAIVKPMITSAAEFESVASSGMSEVRKTFVATVDESSEAWSKTSEAVSTWSESFIAKSNQFVESSAASHDASAELMIHAANALKAAKDTQSSAVDDISTAAEKGHKSAMSALSEQCVSLKENLKSEIVQPFIEKLSEPATHVLHQWIDSANANADEIVGSVQACMDSADSDLLAQVEASNRVIKTVNTFVQDLAADISTGATPVKRSYVFPSPFTKMTPRGKVMKRCRGEDTPIATGSKEAQGEKLSDSDSASDYPSSPAVESKEETNDVVLETAPEAPQATPALCMPVPNDDDTNKANSENEEEQSKVAAKLKKKSSGAHVRASRIPKRATQKKKSKRTIRKSSRNTSSQALREVN